MAFPQHNSLKKKKDNLLSSIPPVENERVPRPQGMQYLRGRGSKFSYAPPPDFNLIVTCLCIQNCFLLVFYLSRNFHLSFVSAANTAGRGEKISPRLENPVEECNAKRKV